MADKKISALTAATTPLSGTEVLPIVQSGATVKVSVDNLTTGKTVNFANAYGPYNGDSEIGFKFDNSYKWGMKNPSADNRSLRVFAQAADGAGRIIFAYGNDVEGMRLETTGNVEVATGNVVMKTAGRGIDFSANTHAPGMTSELLNDYEEGTWTPTQGGGMVVVGSFASNGTYTKVGRFVFVRGIVTGSTSIAATAGGLFCGGFPYTVDIETVLAVNDAANGASPMLVAGTNIYSVEAIAAAPRIVFSATFIV